MKNHLITKIIALMLVLCTTLSFMACSNEAPDSTAGNSNSTNTSTSTKNKLLGDIIPKPTMEYEIINGSDESVYLEVNNATESDFRAYVESCVPYGFDGYIKSAIVPDLYFSEYNAENYFLEVRFNEDEQNFSVYVRVPEE